MNDTDRKRLTRLYGILQDIPLPIVGPATQSASVRGFIRYGQDMAVFRPLISKALLEIRDNDPRSGDDPDGTLDEIEARIAERKAQDWQ